VNESNEMYSFERLLGMIINTEAETAEGMLKDIQEHVNRFVGTADQHDDLTVIVLNTK
jgi:serine phosphatase RsbU (regulator of sigma subunit)